MMWVRICIPLNMHVAVEARTGFVVLDLGLGDEGGLDGGTADGELGGVDLWLIFLRSSLGCTTLLGLRGRRFRRR